MLYTLYDRLKPEAKAELEKSRKEDGYNIVEKTIYPLLKDVIWWDRLTVHQVQIIHTFGSPDPADFPDYFDIMYGGRWCYSVKEYESLIRDTEDNITE